MEHLAITHASKLCEYMNRFEKPREKTNEECFQAMIKGVFWQSYQRMSIHLDGPYQTPPIPQQQLVIQQRVRTLAPQPGQYPVQANSGIANGNIQNDPVALGLENVVGDLGGRVGELVKKTKTGCEMGAQQENGGVRELLTHNYPSRESSSSAPTTVQKRHDAAGPSGHHQVAMQ